MVPFRVIEHLMMMPGSVPQRRRLDDLEASSKSVPINDLCFVQAIDRLGGERLATVADAANGELNSANRSHDPRQK